MLSISWTAGRCVSDGRALLCERICALDWKDTIRGMGYDARRTSMEAMSNSVVMLDTITMPNREEIGGILKNPDAAMTSLSDLLKHPLKAFTGGIK